MRYYNRAETRFGESRDARGDERALYGEPRHQKQSNTGEQALYGDPQHESRGEELTDFELLFAHLALYGVGSESGRSPTER